MNRASNLAVFLPADYQFQKFTKPATDRSVKSLPVFKTHQIFEPDRVRTSRNELSFSSLDDLSADWLVTDSW